MARNSYVRAIATGAVSAGAATIRSIVVTPGSTATTITLYDDPVAATGGREIMTLKFAAGGESRALPFHGLTTARGLWAVIVGTAAEIIFEMA